MNQLGGKRTLPTLVGLAVGMLLGFSSVGNGAVPVSDATSRPLSEFEGFGITTAQVDAEESQYEIDDAKRQQLIAACMAERGFEYTPRPSSIVVTEDLTPAELERLVLDPDSAYLDGLAPDRLLDYNMALTGYEDPNDPTAGAAKGCVGEAHAQVPGIFAVRSSLTKELIELEEAIRTDPAVLEAKKQWAACMVAVGLPVPADLTMGPRAIADSGVDMTETELQTYLAESDRCAAETGLLETETKVRQHSELAFITEHSDVLVKRNGG